jgi:hypothetical protein
MVDPGAEDIKVNTAERRTARMRAAYVRAAYVSASLCAPVSCPYAWGAYAWPAPARHMRLLCWRLARSVRVCRCPIRPNPGSDATEEQTNTLEQ